MFHRKRFGTDFGICAQDSLHFSTELQDRFAQTAEVREHRLEKSVLFGQIVRVFCELLDEFGTQMASNVVAEFAAKHVVDVELSQVKVLGDVHTSFHEAEESLADALELGDLVV